MRCLAIKSMRRIIALGMDYLLGMIKVGTISLVSRAGALVAGIAIVFIAFVARVIEIQGVGGKGRGGSLWE